MRHRNLSIDQAPPFSIPVRFFLTAPLFGIAAVILLFLAGPEILQQRWLPQTIAVTHLFTLGFITMTMIGAMFQLLPVLAGASIYRADLISLIVYILFTLGVIFLTAGLYSGHGIYIQLALVTLAPGLLLFLLTASIAVFSVRSKQASLTGMRLAIIALWVTAILGIVLASGHGIDSVPLLRQHTDTHIAWGVLGWICIMIIAVAYQVIPMFQVTGEYPLIIKRFLSPLLFVVVACWSLAHWLNYDREWLDIATLSLICLLFIVFFSTSLYLLYQRKKRMTDASLYFWIFGLLMLPVSLLTLYFGTTTHSDVVVIAAMIFIVGFILSIINAMLYKILPFLVWLHLSQRRSRHNAGSGLGSIPTLNDIIPSRRAYAQLYLHGTSVILLPAAVLIPHIFYYPALFLLLLSWLLLQTNLLTAAWLYHRYQR